jgi:hypothetical protein
MTLTEWTIKIKNPIKKGGLKEVIKTEDLTNQKISRTTQKGTKTIQIEIKILKIKTDN